MEKFAKNVKELDLFTLSALIYIIMVSFAWLNALYAELELSREIATHTFRLALATTALAIPVSAMLGILVDTMVKRECK